MTPLIAIAALGALVAVPALAQGDAFPADEGPYLGVGLGHAELDNEALDWLERNGARTDDSDTAYKLFAGYQFNPYYAVEASYLDVGEASASGASDADSAILTLGLEGFTAGLIGKLPIEGGLSVHGQLGLIAWEADLDLDATLDGRAYEIRADDDGTDPFYGIGAEYLIERIMIRGEYERYEIGESGEDVDIDLFSASLGYRF